MPKPAKNAGPEAVSDMIPIDEALDKFCCDFSASIGAQFQPYADALEMFRAQAAKNITLAISELGYEAIHAEMMLDLPEYAAWKLFGSSILRLWSSPTARDHLARTADHCIREIFNRNSAYPRSSNMADAVKAACWLPVRQESLRILSFSLKALKTWDLLNDKILRGDLLVSKDECRLPEWGELIESLKSMDELARLDCCDL